MMSPRILSRVALVALAVLGSGCEIRKAMYDQPRYEALQTTEFFGDARSARALVAGTIPRGFLRADAHLYTGMVDGKPADTFPFPITAADLARGRERFNIYCTPCHDQAGTGNGLVVQRGFKVPPSYHIARLREAPPGYFFDVMTRGFGQMSDYSAQIKPEDRWRIAAYVRALQLSQNAKMEDVPEPLRAALHQ